MIKFVFIDVDNTLTSPVTRKFPESALKAIDLARGRGVKVFAATGRHPKNRDEGGILSGLRLDGCLGLNGQMCYLADGTSLRQVYLDREDCLKVIQFSNDMGFSCSVIESGRIYLNFMSERVREYHRLVDIKPPEVFKFNPDDAGKVMMLMGYITREEEAQIAPHLKNCSMVRWNETGCDIIPKDGGKHMGIKAVLDFYSGSMNEVMALGDGENDISMIKAAGIGVAMEHSNGLVKAAADDIAPPVDEDGIYRIFKKYNII